MVSHYIVSGIVFLGVAVGLVGTLYLSYGLMGNAGRALLRRLLLPVIAMASCLLYGLFLSLRPAMLLVGIKPHHLLLDSSYWLAVAAATACALMLGLVMGHRSVSLWLHKRVSSPEHQRLYRRVAYASAGLTFPAMTLATMLFDKTGLAEAVVTAGIVTAMQAALWLGMNRLMLLGPEPSERRLQVIGLLLTLLGIATQLLPPALDLLGVTVR